MPVLPDSVKQAWEDRKGPVVFFDIERVYFTLESLEPTIVIEGEATP